MNTVWSNSFTFVPSGFLWAVFAVIIVIYVAYSLILVYHWNRYSYAPQRTQRIRRVYFLVSIVLMVIMFFAILAYGDGQNI